LAHSFLDEVAVRQISNPSAVMTADFLIFPTVPTITSSLQLLQSPPYHVGNTITAKFTITNKGSVSATFKVLTAGGRGPGGDTDVHDFTHRTDITLGHGQPYYYQGDLKLTKTGNYHFFCAYQTPDGNWNTSVPTKSGVTNILDIEVFRSVKCNATIDWTLRESVRAKLRRDAKRILNRYGYPPDQQLTATENVLKQAELMADELSE